MLAFIGVGFTVIDVCLLGEDQAVLLTESLSTNRPECSVKSADSLKGMSDAAVVNEPPRGHARIVYLGPVSPHWEVYSDYGDANLLEEFRARVLARLVLLPRNDPQFRRNQERVNRDAERERISVEWEIGWADEAA